MTSPFAPLSEDEFEELDQFLLYDVDTEEVMMSDAMDGFLHAIAVGPTMFHDLIWPFNKLYPQVEESAFGKQSPAIYQSVESVIGQLIAKQQWAA